MRKKTCLSPVPSGSFSFYVENYATKIFYHLTASGDKNKETNVRDANAVHYSRMSLIEILLQNLILLLPDEKKRFLLNISLESRFRGGTLS